MFLGNLLDEERVLWFPLQFGTTFDAIRSVLFWVSVLYIAVGLILLIAIRENQISLRVTSRRQISELIRIRASHKCQHPPHAYRQ